MEDFMSITVGSSGSLPVFLNYEDIGHIGKKLSKALSSYSTEMCFAGVLEPGSSTSAAKSFNRQVLTGDKVRDAFLYASETIGKAFSCSQKKTSLGNQFEKQIEETLTLCEKIRQLAVEFQKINENAREFFNTRETNTRLLKRADKFIKSPELHRAEAGPKAKYWAQNQINGAVDGLQHLEESFDQFSKKTMNEVPGQLMNIWYPGISQNYIETTPLIY